MGRRRKLMPGLSWCWGLLFTSPVVALAQPLQEAPLIRLEETLARALLQDEEMQEGRMKWLGSEAEMEAIRNRGGWTLELGGESRNIQGSRRETRDASRGRDPEDVIAGLDQDERYMFLGLTNSFLEEGRKRQADVLDERIKQIDSGASLADRSAQLIEETAAYYLDCYFGRRLVQVLEEEIARQTDELRILEERAGLAEVLQTDVLKRRASVSARNKDRLEWDLKSRRGLEKLRSLWGAPDLDVHMITAPSVSSASNLLELPPGEMVEAAWMRRPDVGLKQEALNAVDQRRPLARSLPELDFGVSTRYGDYDRDYSDEGREDSGLELRVELELRVPLSQARRNYAQDRWHELTRGARVHELEGLRKEIEEEILAANDGLLLAREDLRVKRLLTASAAETHRLLLLRAAELPDSIGEDPQEEIRKARTDWVDARIAEIEAERAEVEAKILLYIAVGAHPGGVPASVGALLR